MTENIKYLKKELEEEKKSKKKVDKEAQAEFKALSLNEKLMTAQMALDSVNGETTKIGEVLNMSWDTACNILAEDGIYYVARIKRFVVSNPFTAEEVKALKSLISGNSPVVKAEPQSEEAKSMYSKIAELKETNRMGKESKNRSFNIDLKIYEEWKAFCDKNDRYAVKDLVALALTQFMDSKTD